MMQNSDDTAYLEIFFLHTILSLFTVYSHSLSPKKCTRRPNATGFENMRALWPFRTTFFAQCSHLFVVIAK